MSRKTVCLCMIVKDEAEVIGRCLASVRPLIDHWIIVDTGSTDATMALITLEMRGIPGRIYRRDWVDFATNRSEALELARYHADYTLIIDADDFLVPGSALPPVLEADSYTFDIEDEGLLYRRPQLVSNRLKWTYRGVLHEFMWCPEARTQASAGITMVRKHDGARRKNPDTYRRDAEVLEAALETETDPEMRARYTFYLAQSYRDSQQFDKAIECYIERAGMGGWEQEVYVSLYQAGRLKEQRGDPVMEVLAMYRAATHVDPRRAEAAHAAVRLCRTHKMFAEGYICGNMCLSTSVPGDALFAEPYAYEVGLKDEMSICAFYSGHYLKSLYLCLEVLASGKVPTTELSRIAQNARFVLDKIADGNHEDKRNG